MLKQLLAGGSVLAVLFAGGLSAQAQAPSPQPKVQPAPQVQVSPAELEKFANAIKQLRVIQQASQAEMVKAVQSEKLSEQRFIQIYQVQQNPQAPTTPKVTPTEKQSFDKAFAKIGQIQQTTQTKMKQVVQSQGMEVQRFNQIFAAVRQNPTLQQKIQQLLQS